MAHEHPNAPTLLQEVLSPANLLTVVRIPLGIAFWFAVTRRDMALAIMLTAAFTDVLDGTVARWLRPGGAPSVGAWLDPLCDKFFMGCMVGAAFMAGALAPIEGAFVLAREIILVPLALIYRASQSVRSQINFDFTAGALGKAATVIQFGTLATALVGDPEHVLPLASLAGTVGVLAAAQYLLRAARSRT